MQTCHPHIYSLTKNTSQASQEEKAKSSASGSSSHHAKKITECFVAHEKYNSDSPYAKVLTKAVGYFIAKDAEAVQTILVDMFQQSDCESNNNTTEPEDVAKLELVSYFREKPVVVKLNSEEDNTDPLERWKDNSYQF